MLRIGLLQRQGGAWGGVFLRFSVALMAAAFKQCPIALLSRLQPQFRS
eukprot:COSAG02_NODE_1520_length_12166_cov_8.338195_18_plen_48_part_00